MSTDSPSLHPDLYGSPTQNSRAQQSRHQLFNSSALHLATDTISTTPNASHSSSTSSTSETPFIPSSHDQPASSSAAAVVGLFDPSSVSSSAFALESHELTTYPSLTDIQQHARHQQKKYLDSEYHYPEPRSKPSRFTKNIRRPNQHRARPSQKSIAHPFETFSDSSDTEHHHHPSSSRRFPKFRRHSSDPRQPFASDHNDTNMSQTNSPFDSQPSGILHQLRWSRAKPPMTRERKLLLLRSYLPDWVFTLVLAGLLTLIEKVYGFRREFSLTDTAIQHTFAVHERVPNWLLGVIAALIPAIIIVFISLVISRSFWDLHNGLLGFILAHALTMTITSIVKVCVGRPRPDLIDRCQPLPGSTNRQPYGLVTDLICSVNPNSSKLRDGFRSFPSGHSSTSFVGLTYLSLYLAAKLHLFDQRGHALVAWLTATPLLAATLVAISRTMDYRHHATDVLAGSLLGIVIAFWIYHLYYPSLSHPMCHKPWSPRIPRQVVSTNSSNFENPSQTGDQLTSHMSRPSSSFDPNLQRYHTEQEQTNENETMNRA